MSLVRRVVLLCLLTSMVVACQANRNGVHLINRTDVELALGFSAAVEACQEAFLAFAQINDSSREPAAGAWTPAVQWVPSSDLGDDLFILVTDNGTQVLDHTPVQLPPCGGQPPDWLP